jgi:hypothetical protein
MTGRGATAAALYAGFLALWALGDAARRRAPSPYLLLGGGLLEAVVDLLRDCDLSVEELIEVRPPADATTRYKHTSLEWARRYPCEEVWRARKRG